MGEFFRGLGKFVQDLLDKIRKPKKREHESISSEFGTAYTEMNDFNDVEKSGFFKIPSNADVSFELVYDEDQLINSLEKYFNIPLTLLPKRIPVKTLLVSLAANQQWDYQAVDMSQYEKKGLAHFIVGRTCDMEELLEEYFSETQYSSEEEEQEDRKFFEEIVEDGLFSTCVGKATLLHYEELGVWSFETEEDD